MTADQLREHLHSDHGKWYPVEGPQAVTDLDDLESLHVECHDYDEPDHYHSEGTS